MGGNVFELTTEFSSDTYNPYARRGGSYNINFANFPAGDCDDSSDFAYADVGFRLTLFL